MFNPPGNIPFLSPEPEPTCEEEGISPDVNGKPRAHDIKLQSILPKPILSGVQKRSKGRGAGPSMVPIGGMNPANMCKICGKWFRSRQQVSQHLLVHTDERKHKCAFCDRAFKQASHLQQHHRIHTGEKPYRCPLPGCERAFPQLSNLNHHLRNHDKPEPPASNTCVYCDRVYASETVMKTHIEKMHMGINGDIKPVIPSTASTKLSQPSVLYSSENFVKIAPAPLPPMTVAPPVLNFSQAFFQPYLHELNLVQHPANLANHGQLPVDSKMTLPVSMPKMNGETYREKVATKSPNESRDNIEHRNGTIDESGCSPKRGKQGELSSHLESDVRNGGIDDSFLPTQTIVNHAFNQRVMNSVIKAVNAAKMFDNSNNVSDESESETDEGFDREIESYEDIPEDYRYSYTLENTIQGNRKVVELGEKEIDNQNRIQNGFEKSQTGDTMTSSVPLDSSTPQQTRSRKRKAFRPQRVVHEKVFIPDDDN